LFDFNGQFCSYFSPDSSGKPFAGLFYFFLAKKSDRRKLFFCCRKKKKTKKLGTDLPTGRQVAGIASNFEKHLGF
jgi:hypothetical protein